MITPDSESIPGQTMIQDPLAVNFMTGGQMGLMPQSQFLTDADYALFRTMPTPDVNGYMSQGDPGWFQNYLMANRGSIAGLPAFTFNTYNPAINSVQQIQQAQRRRYDNGLDTIVGLADVGKSLGEGALIAAGPIGWAGIAASELVGTITKPVMERQATTRAIQNMSTSKVFGGPDSDPVSGYGFNFAGARNIDKFIRESAADDTLFKEGDYRDLLSLGMKYGQFDYSNNSNQYKQVLKKLRDNYTTMMEVLGSTDFEEIMKDMQRMQTMGARQESYGNIARDEQAYARMLGLSHQQAVDTYGKSGALTFQQMGLNAMQGSLQSMANAAGLTYLQRTGTLDPTTVAHYGGISGMAQNMTAQDARVQSNFQDMILPAMMNGSMTGLRTDINPIDLLSGNIDMGTIAAEAGRIRTPGQLANYQASRHKAYTQLQEQVGGADVLEMLMANQYGRMQGYEGQDATRMGLMLGGMDAETAMYKTQEFYSGAAQEARKRTQEEARQKRRDELEQRTNPIRQLERSFRKFTTAIGEGMHGAFTTLWGDTDRKEADQAGRTLPWASPTSRNLNQNTPIRGENNDELIGMYNRSYEFKKKMESAEGMKSGEGYSDDEAFALLKGLSHAVVSETSTTDLNKAMRKTTRGGFGALQLELGRSEDFFGKGKIGEKYGAEFRSYLKEGDQQRLKDIQKKFDSDPNSAMSREEEETLARAQAGWEAVSKQQGFTGDYMTLLMKEGIADRAMYNDPEFAALTKDAGMMAMMFPINNQFGTTTAKKIIHAGIAGMSNEEIQAELAKDGGKSIVKKVYKAAYDVRNSGRGEGDKKDRRYEEGGRDMQNLFRTIDDIRASNAATGGGNGGMFSSIAKKWEQHSLFKGDYGHKVDAAAGTRPDCSGYVHAVVHEYLQQNKAAVPETSELYKMFSGEKPGGNSDSMFAAFVAANNGEKQVYSHTNMSPAERARRMEEELEEGSVIYMLNPKNEGKKQKDWNDYNHIAIVARDEHGKKVVKEMTSGGFKTSSLAEYSKRYDDRDIQTTDAIKALGGRRAGAGGAMTRSQQNDAIRRARDEAYEKTAKLLQEKVHDMPASGILGALGLNDADLTLGQAQHIGAVLTAADDGTYKSKPIMDYMTTKLSRIDGIENPNISENEVNAALLKQSDNLSKFENWSLTGKGTRESKDNGYYKATVDILRSHGLSQDRAEAEAAKLMQEENWTTSLMTALAANNIGGEGGVSDKVRLQGMQLNMAVNGSTLNNLGKLQDKELSKLLSKTMFLGANEGGLSEVMKFLGIDGEKDYGGLYKAAISDKREIQGKDYNAGELSERMPAVYRLLQSQEDLNKLIVSGDLNPEQMKEAKKRLAETERQLYAHGKSVGMDQQTMEDLINGANGVSTAEKKSELWWKTASGGLSEDPAQEALRKKGLEYGKLDLIDAKSGFKKYDEFLKYLDTSGLMSGKRMGDMSNLADTNVAMKVFETLGKYDINTQFLNEMHDKSKMSDEDFQFRIRNLKSGNEGEKKLAAMLEKSRATGEKLDFMELKGAVEEAAGPIGDGGTPNPMATPEERRMAQLNAAFGLGGSGGGGGMFSAETDKALGQLPEVLSKLNDTLTKVDDTLKKNNR